LADRFHPIQINEVLVIPVSMNTQKTRNIAIVAVAAIMLATGAVSMSATQSVLAYKKNQATSQANACGNDFLPTNVGCQNTGSQVQGDENGVALAADQTFPEFNAKHDFGRDHGGHDGNGGNGGGNGGGERVTICHVPPGNPDNPQTLDLPPRGAQNHLDNHELDYEGPCKVA